jgi:integrase
MAAVAQLADPFARHGLAILRGTGMRLGELLDLELDCLWDFGDRGTWVKVPLGKLGTERTVPLDEATLADFDAWMALRGPQRALTHPRHGQPADFLFVERGRRLSAFRLRHGLDHAVAAAALTGPAGQPLRVTPHQLRHTYVISPELFVSATSASAA